jgi:ABC-type transporter Mla subunit MlaD
MSREELLSHLRSIELRLRSAEVQAFFKTQSQADRDRFVSMRNEISQQISQLANAQFQHLADQLNQLSDDLNAGIDNLQSELDSLESTIAILNTISNVLGLVGRVIAFIP